MKRILKIFLKTILFLVPLLLLITVILLGYYFVENKRLEKNDKKLLENSHIRLIQSDTSDIMARLPLRLLPVPQKVFIIDGFYQIPENPVISVNDTLIDDITGILENHPELKADISVKQGDIIIQYINDLRPEGYRMEILPGRISIEFTDIRGLYYAFVSLKILNHNHNGLLPCAVIEDYPDLSVRGLMVDISRDKVPTLQTLKRIAELAADLKYNHLELYVEGFSFAYPSFRELWENSETPITNEEIQVLDAFCRAHYIELVPNQNSLGHMSAWLATEEYADLAECPEGYKLMGILDVKSTLDPGDPRSIELVTRMTDDLLPNFSSDRFNVNLDEPFELGKGKNEKLVKKTGLEQVYLDYVLKIHEMVTARNKEMLMWGDIVLRHPEIINKLPRDITLLDWGYEATYPFERNCKMLKEAGRRFLLCPGTSSWTSIAGRTNNMLGNIATAASNAVKYEAAGILVTDWGDMGHWQYLPVSFAGYVTGGALSWNSRSIKKLPLTSFLNEYVFQDNRQIMGQLALDLGRYMQFEEIPVPNMTTTMLSLQFGLNDRIMNSAIYEKIGKGISEMMEDFAPEMVNAYLESLKSRQAFDYTGLFSFLDEKEALLNNIVLNAPDGNVISDEYRNTIRLIRAGAEIQYFIEKRSQLSKEECIKRLQSVKSLLEKYLNENHRLWMLRNKPGGYDRSTSALRKIIEQIDGELLILQKSGIERGLAQIGKILRSSVATLYLKLI